MDDDRGLTIGDMASRTGLSVSAIRFYEARGLIIAHRTSGNQRRYARSDIRRLSFIKIAQHLGLSLEQVKAELARLPRGRAPTAQDWQGISEAIAAELDAKIAALVATRDKLGGCIGCGCLSLAQCALYNPQDRAARFGAGPRYLMGDKPLVAD
ncbi:redox-sensitive transcriptional activator SoxR [Candidatus Phycosocius bacilliformis]|uniref:Redox-sensitive transcriptional activator SoxR n=1 Tax=Candidatus Phycosocius bacilliformis TaxID=1445552 RepID=A0A2P2EBJ7_9PROT|nr:redox-sensitive transcriptional activator SoxR [Candidatus Phycosocius bacilliformis]GBF58413.1 redox-sensitive transcriptional activator SoxR [Candidatus Phycosocius bacilliformis]